MEFAVHREARNVVGNVVLDHVKMEFVKLVRLDNFLPVGYVVQILLMLIVTINVAAVGIIVVGLRVVLMDPIGILIVQIVVLMGKFVVLLDKFFWMVFAVRLVRTIVEVNVVMENVSMVRIRGRRRMMGSRYHRSCEGVQSIAH